MRIRTAEGNAVCRSFARQQIESNNSLITFPIKQTLKYSSIKRRNKFQTMKDTRSASSRDCNEQRAEE